MAKKVALSFLMLAAFFGICYGALAIFAPQNLKAFSQLDRATLFPALRAGKMFLLAIPHWCWVALGVLSIPSIFLIWAICIIAKIDRIIRVPSATKSNKVARQWWKEDWKHHFQPQQPIKLVPFDSMIFPDKPSLPELTLIIRCEQKSFVKK